MIYSIFIDACSSMPQPWKPINRLTFIIHHYHSSSTVRQGPRYILKSPIALHLHPSRYLRFEQHGVITKAMLKLIEREGMVGLKDPFKKTGLRKL